MLVSNDLQQRVFCLRVAGRGEPAEPLDRHDGHELLVIARLLANALPAYALGELTHRLVAQHVQAGRVFDLGNHVQQGPTQHCVPASRSDPEVGNRGSGARIHAKQANDVSIFTLAFFSGKVHYTKPLPEKPSSLIFNRPLDLLKTFERVLVGHGVTSPLSRTASRVFSDALALRICNNSVKETGQVLIPL